MPAMFSRVLVLAAWLSAGAALSPNGRYVAVRKLGANGRIMLAIVDAEARESRPLINYGNADINLFYWLSDERLAYTVINVDQGGDINLHGLFAIDRDGKKPEFLATTVMHERSFAERDPVDHAYLTSQALHGFPYAKAEEIYVLAHTEEKVTLQRLNTRNGLMAAVRAPYGTYGWLLDPEGDARVFMARQSGRNTVIYNAQGDWRRIGDFDVADEPGFTPQMYAGGSLYVKSNNGKDEAALYRYDLKKNALDAAPLISAPGYDVDGAFDVDEKKILGYRFDTDADGTIWFDATMKAIQQEVDQLRPGTINTVSRGRRSETPYVLIDAHSDIENHSYILYNRETKMQALIGKASPDLVPAQMAHMTMVRYPARDGLQIPAYITLPKAAPQKNLPTVVLVGELPWRRNGVWSWNAEVQFLVSRGYVVIQPEPRGEAGFGKRHYEAGAKQWGMAIQDDIADAVKWAVAQGYTDPARVCIAGTGYGGYAAMMGLIRDPDLYKCGVSWSGITDIGAMFKKGWDNMADQRSLDVLRATVGDPQQDAAQLRATSPLYNAARIRQPVLIAYGKQDETVGIEQGRAFYEAVHAGNPRAEWREYAASVEDWKTQKNRTDLWRQIDAFLAKNIGQATP